MSKPTTQAFLTISASIVFTVLHFAGCDFLNPCDRTGGCSSGFACDPASWLCLPDEEQSPRPCDATGGCPDGYHCDPGDFVCIPGDGDPAEICDPDTNSIVPGKMFGACNLDGTCDPGEGFCLTRPDGWVCAPACGLGSACENDDGAFCADALGDPMARSCDDAGACWVLCTFPEECDGDAVCSDGACVWPL